jgi:hypothetical protein
MASSLGSNSSLTSDNPESPYSSPDSSPTIRRPFTTVGWEHPYTSVSPSTSRPSTTIGWESRILEKATLEKGGRRWSVGQEGRRQEWRNQEGRRYSGGTRKTLGVNQSEGGKSSGEDSDESDWNVSASLDPEILICCIVLH